jgi:hypothetical protein
MALEFKGKGYSMLLGPVSGPLGRSVYSGRLFETFVSGIPYYILLRYQIELSN